MAREPPTFLFGKGGTLPTAGLLVRCSTELATQGQASYIA